VEGHHSDGASQRLSNIRLRRWLLRDSKKLERGVALSAGQVLRLRVRYMADGLVLGSKNYVNAIFAEHRDLFGAKRKSGARSLQGVGGALGSLMTARDLQVAPIS
jgi:hypothetical protein